MLVMCETVDTVSNGKPSPDFSYMYYLHLYHLYLFANRKAMNSLYSPNGKAYLVYISLYIIYNVDAHQ